MTPTRPFLFAAFLGFSSLLQAEDVPAQTTPSAPGGDKKLSDKLDPVPAPQLSTDLPAAPPAAAAPSENVTINLINRLVQKGILTQAEAAEMIQQAKADAVKAAASKEVAALPPEPSPEEEARISYIPDVVRNQMRDQIKQELMAQAHEERWSEKNAPDWTSKFRPFGDIRGRYDSTLFQNSNDSSGSFTNFYAINSGAPYDAASNQYPPSYNDNQDRNRTRLRARFGTDIMLGDGFNAGIRLATGDTNSPTSTNQTLGGSGGNFSKYAIWLDRAFISYDAGPGDGEELTFLLGRFDNPFFCSDIQWDDDIGFDGLAVRGKVNITDKVSTFFSGGYFPVYNTDFNFASNQPSKFSSNDKWLAAAQAGINWKITSDLTARFAVSYYDFTNISGKLSDPFTPLSASDAGNTDTTRPAFSQRGNTYMPLRDIVPTAANGYGNLYQYQYYGLASQFRDVTLTAKLDYDHFDSIRLSLLGEAIKNVAFDASSVAARAYSDGRVGRTINALKDFQGGDTAWLVAFQVGNPVLEKFGDWQASIGYRHVESDAVVDGFTDSDFGGGGTNVQGYTLGATMALSPTVRCGLRWMSSNEITGPPLSTDILQFDINAKF